MGSAFVQNLLADGHCVSVLDRDPVRVAALQKAGADPAARFFIPSAAPMRDRLVALTARGWGALDWSALGLLAARDAGLDAGADASDATKPAG